MFRRVPLMWLLPWFFSAAALADFELPLIIQETQGAGGQKCISNGVPLLPGMAADTKELHVLAPDGREVPAQFRVLARYWRGDQSIRWVLVDFIAQAAEKDDVTYTLVGRKAEAPVPAGPKLVVTEDDEFIRINTEAALFEISRKKFNLLNRVQCDDNLDGQFTENETVVFPDPKLGSVVTDPKGVPHYSSQGSGEVTFIDRGPVRVTVMAKGVHRSAAAGADKGGLYGYEIYMTFHAGLPFCDVDAILTNNFAEPMGEPHFKDWSILTRCGPDDDGGWGMNVVTSGGYCNDGGGDSITVYQDSLGTSQWKSLPGFEPRTGTLATFRGYKVWKNVGGKREEIESGDFCRGVAQCGRGNMGMVIAPKYFWQQFPAAIEYGKGGLLRYGMFPKEYSTVHWLEDGSAKGRQFRLFFYIKNPRPKKTYTPMSSGFRPYAHCVLDDYLSKPLALPSPAFCGKAGALSDIGPYTATDPRTPHGDFSLARWERRYMMDDELKGNSYGWQPFGNRWEESMGHSPWNYEPKVTSASLYNYLVTRRPNWLEKGMRLSRQARDVRAYLIDDTDWLDKWSKPGAYQRQSIIEMWQRRKPAGEAHPYRRDGWYLPNHEHINLDEVYDLYLLTGDERARRCMECIAAHAAMQVGLPRQGIAVTRATGWGLRALARYVDLTGDRRYEPYLRQAIENFWSSINKAGCEGAGTWFLGIYARGVIAAYLAGGDERMRDLAIGCADWARHYESIPEGYPYHNVKDMWSMTPEQRSQKTGGKCSWANVYLLDPLAWAYVQTGNPEYLKAFEVAWSNFDDARTDWITFIPSALLNAFGPRADSTAPAAIGDLKASGGKGEATLTWKAPGGDGDKGRAAVYQVKYATRPIVEFVTWPDQRDTHVNFWSAENVSDEPAPKDAGQNESFTVKGLAPGRYYFAIKSRDEANNQSPISNVVEAEVN